MHKSWTTSRFDMLSLSWGKKSVRENTKIHFREPLECKILKSFYVSWFCYYGVMRLPEQHVCSIHSSFVPPSCTFFFLVLFECEQHQMNFNFFLLSCCLQNDDKSAEWIWHELKHLMPPWYPQLELHLIISHWSL